MPTCLAFRRAQHVELARLALTLTVLLSPSPEAELAIDVAVLVRADVPSEMFFAYCGKPLREVRYAKRRA